MKKNNAQNKIYLKITRNIKKIKQSNILKNKILSE